jgi:hypothetical protein
VLANRARRILIPLDRRRKLHDMLAVGLNATPGSSVSDRVGESTPCATSTVMSSTARLRASVDTWKCSKLYPVCFTTGPPRVRRSSSSVGL